MQENCSTQWRWRVLNDRIRSKIQRRFDKAAQGLTVLSVSSFTLLLFTAVICRYLLKTSILFEEEGSKILFVWACFMGASVAYKRKAHIWFNFIERFIGCRGSRFPI